MKKAVLDQLFLGFLLLMGIVTFVATVNDETSTRNYIYDLKALVKSSANAMARYYESNIDMCTAQNITTSILNQQKLGNETLSNQLVSYRWWDSDGDGEPDQVTASIAQHPYDTFWYRFFDKNDFTVGPFSWTEAVNTPRSVTITYGGESAGFTNMVGLYDLDRNNCVTNTRIILANSDDHNLVGTLLNNGTAITSPPTHVFLISDGYNIFKNGYARPNVGDTMTFGENGNGTYCFDNVSGNPTVNINGVKRENANVYFEHNELNGDGYPHIQIIPESVWTTYNEFVGGYGAFAGQGTQTYDDFIDHCNVVNYDNNQFNNIPDITNDPATSYKEGVNDCIHDINDEYRYAMEDLNGGGDEDFNDIFLNTTRVVIPNQLNTYSVLSDGSINLTCNGNAQPTLVLSCPAPIDENTTSTFSFTSSDDKWISDITGSAINGSVLVGTDSITYTPNTDFYGDDIITIIARDNEGSSNIQTCTITVNNINQAPVISGNPMRTIQAGSIYSFVPVASDPDGDNLTFSISNKPLWANFDTNTGQLSGAPNNSQVGNYTSIVISVSDGFTSVSLPSFSINVTENINNNAPQCQTIPTQTATETENFSLNLDTYCTDSDGDDVTYTVTAASLGYNTTTNAVLSTTIPDNTQHYSPVIVNIIATDGTDSTNTSFILNIIANVECTINETDDFSSNSEYWSGGYRYNSYYVIERDDYGYKTYNFGNGCKNVDVSISLNYATPTSWESNEKLEVYLNNTYSYGFYETNGYWTPKNFSGTTDSSGNLKITFRPNTSWNDEWVAIDEINIVKQ